MPIKPPVVKTYPLFRFMEVVVFFAQDVLALHK